jgi:hypothetical protein
MMGLILPGNGFAYCTTNISGTPATGGPGTTVTANATPNTDGTSVSFIAAITHDVHLLKVSIHSCFTSGTNTSSLLDILIDPAGGTSWATAPLIDDLLAGYVLLGTSGAGHRVYEFPIYIKSGSSIGGRVRSATGSKTCVVIVEAYGEPSRPDEWWCGSKVQGIGIVAASSKGTDHTPGSTGTFSTWTNFGSTLTQPCGALQFATQGGAQTTLTAVAYHFQMGVNSVQIGPTVWKINDSGEACLTQPLGLMLCNLPTGTQMMVRGTCSGTAQAQDLAIYAVQ